MEQPVHKFRKRPTIIAVLFLVLGGFLVGVLTRQAVSAPVAAYSCTVSIDCKDSSDNVESTISCTGVQTCTYGADNSTPGWVECDGKKTTCN